MKRSQKYYIFLLGYMRIDEFNSVNVKNDKVTEKAEYFKTQKNEYSDKGDMELHSTKENVNINQNSKINAVKSSGITSTSTTISQVAATSTTVVAVASTVAVTAISVATGISVALHDYQYKFDSFIVSANELSYDLVLRDLKNQASDELIDGYQSYEEEEKSNFTLRVYNANYDRSDEIWLGYNSGSFSNLTLGETYNIVLSEDRYGGEVILEETFTTAQNSFFSDFYLEDVIDLINGTVFVTLDYLDELNAFSDLDLTISDDSGVVARAPLIKTKERQEVILQIVDDHFIEPETNYSYSFSYVKDGQKTIFKEGEIAFHDISGGVTEFHKLIFDKTANFLSGEFVVQLDYQDDFNSLSDFNLNLKNENNNLDYNFPLEKTKEPQTIATKEYGFSFLIDYTYTLTYKEEGIEKSVNGETFTFIDNSGAVSEFNQFIFDKTANFLTGEFIVQLDYQDDFNDYSDFVFTLNSVSAAGGESKTIAINLEKTTAKQTISGNEYGIDFRNTSYTYELTCLNKGQKEILDSGTVTFIDNSGAVSEFNQFIFDKTANFLTGEFSVQLDYQDDFNDFSNFVLTLNEIDVTGAEGTKIEISLQKTTSVQTINGLEYNIDFRHASYSYALTCLNKNLQETLDSGEVKFTDTSGAVSAFNEFIFDKTANFLTGEFIVQLDYQDDFDILSDFSLNLKNEASKADYNFPLEKTTESQTIATADYNVSFLIDYTYTLTYKEEGIEKSVTSEPFTFTDTSGAVSEFNSLTFVNGEANYATREFMVQLDYQDDLSYFDDFTLVITDTVTSNSKTINLDKTTDAQSIILDEKTMSADGGQYYLIDIVNHSLTYSLTYYDTRTGTVDAYKDESLSFTNSLHSTFNGFDSSYDIVTDNSGTAVSYLLPIKFDYNDEASIYGEFSIELLANETSLGTVSYNSDNRDISNVWLNGYIALASENIDDLIGQEITIVVYCEIYDEKNNEILVDEARELYRTTHTFTLDQNTNFFGLNVNKEVLSDTATYQAIYSGNNTSFTNCRIILETALGNTYTYEVRLISQMEYNNVNLLNPLEGEITNQDDFDAEFSQPMKISFQYCTITYETSDEPTHSDTTEVISDPITVVCYDAFTFVISH